MNDPFPGSGEILKLFVKTYNPDDIVDLGGGGGRLFPLLVGREVTVIDHQPSPQKILEDFPTFCYEVADFRSWKQFRKYGAAITSHTIEHMADTEWFLRLFFSTINEGSPWCIIWPPPKPQIVSGHVHIFNLGLMLFNVVRLGISCKEAVLVRKDYSLGIMNRKQTFTPPSVRPGDNDLPPLAPWFPCKIEHGFNGDSGLGELKL